MARMRIYYTGNDIEDLAASGVRQLEVGAGVGLTDAARERAEELGIALVTAGAKRTADKPAPLAAPSGAARDGALPARPRGCQHGPLAAKAGAARGDAPAGRGAGGSPVVEQLVAAVSALKKRGG